MGKTIEYADDEPVEMKKKLKKNKNKDMTDDLLLVSDGNSPVETDGDDLKRKKKDKNEEKKRISELKDLETDGDRLKKEKRDKHGKNKKKKLESKEGGDEEQHDNSTLVDDDLQKKNKKRKRKYSSEKEELTENEMDQNAEPDVEKDCDSNLEKKKTDTVKGTGISMKDGPEDTIKKIDKEKKKKKKKKNIDGQNLDTEMNGMMTDEATLKTRDIEEKSMGKQKIKDKKKTSESVENNTEKPKTKSKSKSKSKRVSFSGHVEVFPPSDSDTHPEKQTTKGDGLVRGKRFTPEEDEIVKQAVLDYIAAKGLGEDGLNIILNCRSHKGMKKCWQEIGLCIPYRPHTAVYYRAHILFERGDTRSWTPEEIELLKEFHEKYGNDWKKLANEFGKHRIHVKDTWRRIKFENRKIGKWSQEEYQNLHDLVNLDLLMKVNGEENRMSKHGMLRDNIPWTAISEKLTTRTDATCCMKWYRQLTSSLVAENKWCDVDDYRLIGALYKIDAACAEDVDWDNVLEHRPGDICYKRWTQMVKHVGDYGSKTFAEQVDILAQRYCPDLAETREAWDSKPVV